MTRGPRLLEDPALRWRQAAAVAGIGLVGAATAQAQAIPTRPITLVVPFAAGGPTDGGQALSVPMARTLGQTVVVENKVGASGSVAATRWCRGPSPMDTPS